MRFLGRAILLSLCASVSVLALLVLGASEVRAAVPNLISYQGVLTDGSGNPVADGSYSLTFAIYSLASGGSSLWSETRSR